MKNFFIWNRFSKINSLFKNIEKIILVGKCGKDHSSIFQPEFTPLNIPQHFLYKHNCSAFRFFYSTMFTLPSSISPIQILNFLQQLFFISSPQKFVAISKQEHTFCYEKERVRAAFLVTESIFSLTIFCWLNPFSFSFLLNYFYLVI